MMRDTFGIDGVLRPSGTRWLRRDGFPGLKPWAIVARPSGTRWLRRDGFPGLKPWAIVARPSGTKGRYANGTLEACAPRGMPKLGTAGRRPGTFCSLGFLELSWPEHQFC